MIRETSSQEARQHLEDIPSMDYGRESLHSTNQCVLGYREQFRS